MTYWHYSLARHGTALCESLGPHEKGACEGTDTPRDESCPEDEETLW